MSIISYLTCLVKEHGETVNIDLNQNLILHTATAKISHVISKVQGLRPSYLKEYGNLESDPLRFSASVPVKALHSSTVLLAHNYTQFYVFSMLYFWYLHSWSPWVI